MATTYYAQSSGSKLVRPPAKAFSVGRTTTHFSMTPVLFGIGDIIVLAIIPIDTMGSQDGRGTWIDFIYLQIPVLDTVSSFAWQLGDATAANTYLDSMTLGRTTKPGKIITDTSAIAATNVAGSLGDNVIPKKYTQAATDQDVRITVTAAQAGLVATNPIKGYVTYSLEESL